MYKMKDVCAQTKLSEKAVRLYMKEGLITPTTEEGYQRNSYFFTEEDIEVLKGISTLRSAGFSIKDIRQMQEHPQDVSRFCAERSDLLSQEIEEKKRIQEAIRSLSFREQRNTSELADALEASVNYDPSREPGRMPEDKKVRIGYFALFIFGVLIASAICFWRFGMQVLLGVYGFLGILLAALCLFAAVRCMGAPGRGRRMEHQEQGVVLDVVRERGFDISFSRAGSRYAGTREPGIGGIWQFFFLFWGEFRPDNWYPVIELEKQRGTIGSFYCGSTKNAWKAGEHVSVAWDGDMADLFYPIDGGWITKKAIGYAALSLALAAASFACFGTKATARELILPETIECIEVTISGDSQPIILSGQTAETFLNIISERVPANGRKKSPGQVAGSNRILISLLNEQSEHIGSMIVQNAGEVYYEGYRFSVPYTANSEELPLGDELILFVRHSVVDEYYHRFSEMLENSQQENDPRLCTLLSNEEAFGYAYENENLGTWDLYFEDSYTEELFGILADMDMIDEIKKELETDGSEILCSFLSLPVDAVDLSDIKITVSCMDPENQTTDFESDFR